MEQSGRPVISLVAASRTLEGAGFPVRRPFPTADLDNIDPFLMLDEVGPIDWPPGAAIGAPDHPHRGFETISYILDGEKLHEDSTGDRQILGPGDVQWMTAGSGIVHSELPGPRIREQGGRSHGFQIWVNLPARHKMAPPRYQFVGADRIPLARAADGLVSVRVIAGEAFGVDATIDTHTPVMLQDWTIRPGGTASPVYPMEHRLAAYVFAGGLAAGRDGRMVADGQLVIFGEGDRIDLAVPATADQAARFLLFGGEPIGEPIARHGPFVMNTREELLRAFEDYRSGRMGTIRR
ncbi:MAG: pirin family protein [Alphaproteobacteria bacterium]|jgi:hypothetical protein|nr:pirin family protein [Alphaproteobacteria bacterium]MDP6564234.1 pirin family protein [Alphaproteobacteria bacterium]MDP6814006.1 pirin family protein [Alphaproteobacteria bacterium]